MTRRRHLKLVFCLQCQVDLQSPTLVLGEDFSWDLGLQFGSWTVWLFYDPLNQLRIKNTWL